MSQTVIIDNFGPLNIVEVTQLDADAAAAQKVVVVKNPQNIATGKYCMVGLIGSEESEMSQVDTVSTNQITMLANLAEAHKRFDELTVLFGNKIELWRAANVNGTPPDDSAFSVVGSAVDIDPDQKTTPITDPTGGVDYWYKMRFLNSTTSTRTALADSVVVRGGNIGNYCTIDDIRGEAGLRSNRWITDAEIDKKRQAAQREIDGELRGIYTLPFTPPISPVIRQIASELAAGFLLLVNYGPMSTLNTNNGQQKVDEARKKLKALSTKDSVIIDANGNDTSIPGTVGGYSGWPNSTTKDAEPEQSGGDFKFRNTDRY